MRKLVGSLIGILYCFPFVYYSMYQDYVDGSMLGYLMMIIATSLLAFLSRLFSNSIYFITGNIVSLVVSFYFIGEMGKREDWGYYFKPLSPYQLLILVSFLNLIPQFFAMKLAKMVKKKLTTGK